MIDKKNEAFGEKLEEDKKNFAKDIVRFTDLFSKIKGFNSLNQSQEFNMDAFNLRKDLDKGYSMVKQFHDRETLFGLPETPYPELDDIDKSFKPFFDLVTMSYDVKMGLNEWTQDRLMGQDFNKIDGEVKKWNSSCQ